VLAHVGWGLGFWVGVFFCVGCVGGVGGGGGCGVVGGSGGGGGLACGVEQVREESLTASPHAVRGAGGYSFDKSSRIGGEGVASDS